MEARLIALEDRLRQTEEVVVAERLARQTAEAARQTLGPPPAGAGGGERPPGLPSLVDKAIGKPPTFGGEPEGMPVSVEFRIPAFGNQVAEAGGNKRGRSRGRRQHAHDGGGETTFDTIVLRACSDLQRKGAAGGPTSSRRVRVQGVETAVQRV